ncbi:MAG: HAD hydrolase-like protein [Candidatus Woesearchaeota archaeon]
MSDHHKTAKQAIKENFGSYLNKSSYKVTHRLKDVTGLVGLDYDLFILDRDCTLQEYHGKKRVPEFEETLKLIGPKAELVSNSPYEELLRIRDLYGDLMNISKLVKFYSSEKIHLLRFEKGKLKIYVSTSIGEIDNTENMSIGDTLFETISYNYKKPNPEIIKKVIEINQSIERIPHNNPKVLMVGDRYLTDIVCGNLAGVDTARVKPYKPLSDKPDLIAMRVIDSMIGNFMSKKNN